MTRGDDHQAYQKLLVVNRHLEYMHSTTSTITYAARADDTFELTSMSAGVKDVLGHDASSFIGSRSFGTEHMHPDELATLGDTRAQLLETGVVTFRVRYRHAQGHYVWMEGAARLVRDAQGVPEEIVGYWIDVTDRPRAERALERSRVDDETQSPVDVVAVLGSALRSAHNEVRHRARVVRDLDEALPRVHANAARLGQVLLNLILNAAQAIPAGRSDANEIRVRARPSADRSRVIIEVEDASTSRDAVFDPFATNKSIRIGRELGLAICGQIIRSMDGVIEVTSEPDRGSVFRVILPAAPASPSTAPEVDSDRPTKTRRTILFVDDEPLLGRSTRLLLAPHHEVIAVTSGREAIHRIASGESFDLIMCDLMMPVMTGIELYTELERVAPAVLPRIVFMTGGAFTEEAQTFLAVPGRRHLEKPFSLRAVRAVIEDDL